MTLGLDISTTTIGISLFNGDGELMELTYVKFNSKQTIFEKFESFVNQIKHLENQKLTHIAIEEPLKKFKGKFSNANTIAVLNFFNGMISGYLYDKFKIEPIHYNVNTVRATIFPDIKNIKEGPSLKYQVWEKVMKLEPQINWIYSKKTGKLIDENFDMADAYAVGLCGIVTRIQQQEALNKKKKGKEA